jgi:hypothetical protein
VRKSWKTKLKRLIRKQNLHVLASFTAMITFWFGVAWAMQWGLSNVVDEWLSSYVLANWRP